MNLIFYHDIFYESNNKDSNRGAIAVYKFVNRFDMDKRREKNVKSFVNYDQFIRISKRWKQINWQRKAARCLAKVNKKYRERKAIVWERLWFSRKLL